jgi:DNA (cytosine-5)-methyltransferase 1
MGGVRKPSKDDRTNLFLGFAAAVNKVKPKVFIAENVSGLTTLQNGKWFKQQIRVYERGLDVKYHVAHLLVKPPISGSSTPQAGSDRRCPTGLCWKV